MDPEVDELAPEPPDYTEQFNTKLSAPDEVNYQAWVAQRSADQNRDTSRDTFDYDLRGAWKADARAAANGHLPDTWKKPNHPTFSTGSQYSGVGGMTGGTWIANGKKWFYQPSATNLNMYGPEGLREYFRQVEPDSQLLMAAPAAEGRASGGAVGGPWTEFQNQPAEGPWTAFQGSAARGPWSEFQHADEGRQTHVDWRTLPLAKTEDVPVNAPVQDDTAATLAKTPLEDRMMPQVGQRTAPPDDYGLAERARQGQNIRQAITEGYKEGSQLLSPLAQKWADDHGLGGDARVVSAALGAFNAIWRGAAATADSIGQSIGIPSLGRDAAGMIESAGMTGAPHIPGVAHAELPEEPAAPHETPPAAPFATPTLDAMAAEAQARAPVTPEQAALAELEHQAAPKASPEPPPATPATEALAAKATEPASGPWTEFQGEGAGHEPPSSDITATQSDTVSTESDTVPAERGAPPITADNRREPPETRVGEEQPSETPSAEKTNSPEVAPDGGARVATPFEPIPREPERLSSFVRRMGGVQDVGGDIRSSLGGSKYRPGLINKNGLPLDEAALRAWQSGYFPQFGDERPSINDLREALHDDLNGRPVYSHHDEGALAAYQEAIQRNAEIDRLADEHGIPTQGRTQAQFFDDLHDRLSTEDFARELAERDASRAAEDAKFERMAKQWTAGNGEGYESLYGQSQARTLEDLEREYREETSAPAPEQHDAGAAEPERAGPSAPAGEGGAGPDRRGAGDAGGVEAEGARVKIGEPELTGYYSGQKDLVLRAENAAGHPLGYVKWTEFGGVPEINYIEVEEGARRQGVAAALIKRLSDEYGGYNALEWSSQTDEGAALKAALDKRFSGPSADLLGRPIAEPAAPRTPEPTIRNDARQDLIPGTEPSAVQAQAARDAQGRGALLPTAEQKPANEGLFANPETPSEASLFDIAKAVVTDRKGGGRQSALNLETKKPQFELLRDKQGLAKAAGEIRAGLAPTSMRGAKPMEYALRQHNAESAQAYDRALHALEKVRRATDELSKQAQVEFTDRMERGEAQPTPQLQAVADALRGQLDGWARKIQGLGKGYLANAVENYMGHIWGNYAEWAAREPTDRPQSEMQATATARNVRRQPLRGSGAFLKQRSFPTQLEGIEAGLVPVTFNPVDLQMIKLHEMQKFYHGTVLADRMKDSRLATWVPATAESERDAQLAGWQKLDDTIFKPRIMGANNEAGFGRLEPGNYWAPEPIARVFNNYMSQGWHGRSAIYDAARMSNNALNTLQLGLSGFHAAFVTADTAISKVALGIQQIAQGHALRGAGNILEGSTIAPAVARTVYRGAQLRKAWLDPEGATPEMQRIVDALKAGGGRISMPRFFQTSASGAFFRSIADLKHPQSAFHQVAQMFRDADGPLEKAVMVPARIAARVLDTLQEPLMGTLVPRAKLGVFADMAQNWLRDHPEATREELSEAMTKFQDSVDNRLGQLNYDNLFWNKVAKDIAFVTTRSVGWNLGTVREIGGAFVDSADAIKAIANGKAPQLTTRMAYTVALPIITAEIGAILTYLATAKPPQSMLDYFYPPTGEADENGHVDRRSIPGYMKDVVAFWMDPIQTALNKTAPMLETLNELRQNRDYYGGIIYDPERDRGPVQAYGDYLLNQAAPFSLRSYNRLHGEGAPALDQALGFWGFQPAPKSITQPERGAAFQRRSNLKAYRARAREPGRLEILNAPPSQP